MFSLSILTLSLFPISNALLVSNTLDPATDPPVPTVTPANALGPVSQLYIANNPIAPDGYNRS